MSAEVKLGRLFVVNYGLGGRRDAARREGLNNGEKAAVIVEQGRHVRDCERL